VGVRLRVGEPFQQGARFEPLPGGSATASLFGRNLWQIGIIMGAKKNALKSGMGRGRENRERTGRGALSLPGFKTPAMPVPIGRKGPHQGGGPVALNKK